MDDTAQKHEYMNMQVIYRFFHTDTAEYRADAVKHTAEQKKHKAL